MYSLGYIVAEVEHLVLLLFIYKLFFHLNLKTSLFFYLSCSHQHTMFPLIKDNFSTLILK